MGDGFEIRNKRIPVTYIHNAAHQTARTTLKYITALKDVTGVWESNLPLINLCQLPNLKCKIDKKLKY
jgi:hypothetical protein